MAKDIVMIPATVEMTTPEPNEYKPFSTTLTFNHKLVIEVPVSAEEVTKKGDTYTLTLEGWKQFLLAYSKMTKTLFNKLYQP
jgi:hypothetical protein